jgi:hypothetical protein
MEEVMEVLTLHIEAAAAAALPMLLVRQVS